jgi:uncharacterized damage-inducible protein DinB
MVPFGKLMNSKETKQMQDELGKTVSTDFAAYYQSSAKKLHEWVDPLSTVEIWRKPYPYGNSIGHLLLHLTGNLNYYIGARIANTGYVRNRDLEFTDRNLKPKEELLKNFDTAIEMVVTTIKKQTEADWFATYTAERSDATDRLMMVLNCAGHLYHHVGQIIYLSKELARQRAASA